MEVKYILFAKLQSTFFTKPIHWWHDDMILMTWFWYPFFKKMFCLKSNWKRKWSIYTARNKLNMFEHLLSYPWHHFLFRLEFDWPRGYTTVWPQNHATSPARSKRSSRIFVLGCGKAFSSCILNIITVIAHLTVVKWGHTEGIPMEKTSSKKYTVFSL